MIDTKSLRKTAITERGQKGKRRRKREQNWTKVSSLIPPPAAVKPSHSPTAKWTLWPYCSHSAHLLHPPLSSLSSLSPFSISSLQENRHWESILHHKSNHIILSFSISTLSLPPSTSSSLYHSPIFPPFPCSASASLLRSEGESHVLKDGSQGVENFPVPGV